MLKPLVEYRPYLNRLESECPQSIVRLVAAASQSGVRAINVHPDLVGSSFLREGEEDSDDTTSWVIFTDLWMGHCAR